MEDRKHSPEWWEENRLVEQYGWDNPVLSRKDVYDLFKMCFKEEHVTGNGYERNAARECREFLEKVRILAKTRAKTYMK